MSLHESIVCVGDNCVDVTRPHESERDGAGASRPAMELAGGNAFNVAVALARLGRTVAYAGAVGDDAGARLILEAAAAAGVDTSQVQRRPGATGRTIVDHDPDGERRFVSEDYGVAAEYRLDTETATWLAEASWLHFARQTDLADWGSTLRLGRARQSCDLGHPGGVELLERVAPIVDVVFMSASSGGGLTPERMLRRGLAAGAALVVVTIGAHGSIAASATERWRMEATPVPRVVDTLGAGDAYIAAFIAARLAGQGVQAAMRAGADAGAAACTRWGLAHADRGTDPRGVDPHRADPHGTDPHGAARRLEPTA